MACQTTTKKQKKTVRPIVAAPKFENIPSMLKVKKNWVLWKYVRKDKKWTKPPYRTDGSFASTSDQSTWTTFDEVKNIYEKGGFDGIGYVFDGSDNLKGVDLDHILEQDTIKEDCRNVLNNLNSYTEFSPSDEGVHCLVYSDLNLGKNKCKKGNIELFQDSSFFTFTGNILSEYPKTIEDRNHEFRLIYNAYFAMNSDKLIPEDERKEEEKKKKDVDEEIPNLDDEEVIRIAAQLSETKFNKLMEGEWQFLGYPSSSEARMALLDMLAYYCSGKLQIDRIFRRSELYEQCKDKWDRLAESEIAKAISGCKGHYRSSNDEQSECIINISKVKRLHEQVELAIGAICKYNLPPVIFNRSGELCSIVEVDDNNYRISRLEKGAIRQLLSKSSRWVKSAGKNKLEDVYPPIPVVESIYGLNELNIPRLAGITTLPIVRSDGSIFNTKGFDFKSGYYYMPPKDFDIPLIPEAPTKEDSIKAAEYIKEELFLDFPFVDEASKTNAIAALLTPIVRPMIEGCTPLALIDKTTPGTGASLIVNIISIVATGKNADMTKDPGSEEEWRKTLFSLLYEGKYIICFDNVDANLGSSTLSLVLTSSSIESRILGKSKTVNVPNRSVWMAKGNQLQVAGDIARRSYLIQMDAKMAEPWTRDTKGFKHPNLIAFTKQNRAKILEAIYTMIRAWVEAGKPCCNLSMGNFEEWINIVGGILEYAGLKDFMTNPPWKSQLDVNANEWEAFIGVLHDEFGEKEQTTNELMLKLKNNRNLNDVLPTEIEEAIKKDSSRSLGKILSKKNNVRYKNGLMMVVTKGNKNISWYKVLKVKN
jgi:hypothetical protein